MAPAATIRVRITPALRAIARARATVVAAVAMAAAMVVEAAAAIEALSARAANRLYACATATLEPF